MSFEPMAFLSVSIEAILRIVKADLGPIPDTFISISKNSSSCMSKNPKRSKASSRICV